MGANDPKYDFIFDTVVNAASGEKIPLDEPVMVFRARDVHAVRAIEAYLSAVHGDPAVASEHVDAVKAQLIRFLNFSMDHRDRMKTPDTEPAHG